MESVQSVNPLKEDNMKSSCWNLCKSKQFKTYSVCFCRHTMVPEMWHVAKESPY